MRPPVEDQYRTNRGTIESYPVCAPYSRRWSRPATTAAQPHSSWAVREPGDNRGASGSEPVYQLLDQERALAHGLFAEGSEPLGDLAKPAHELRLVAALYQAEVLLEGLDVVL